MNTTHKIQVLLLFIAPLLFAACFGSRLSQDEINALSSTNLSPLQLQPSHQIDGFRLDVVRQTEETCSGDDSSTESDVPYHPLGFDLGNGLFFDMNHNLSFRMDKLLDIPEGEDYVVQITQGNQVSYRVRKGNETCHQSRGFLGIAKNRCSESNEEADALRVFCKGKLSYEIASDEQETRFLNRKRKKEWTIKKEASNKYTSQRRQRKIRRNFLKEENSIILGSQYRIIRNDETQTISIYEIHRKRDFFLYDIKMGKNKIMVYDARNRGFKIEKYNEKMLVFNNMHLQYEFKKIQ